MAPKRKHASTSSPAQRSAKAIRKKYTRGKRMTPEKAANVRRALFCVCNNEMSLRKASREYGLSYGFLQRRYSGEVDINKTKGPDTVFTEVEEERMATWLSEMTQRGMGLMVCEFLDFVQHVVNKEKRKTPFTDGRPTYHWYRAFKNRNAHIIDSRTENALELKRSKVTKEVTDHWYDDYRDFLIRIDCLDKPKRIWNADESGFNMGSTSTKVIGPAQRDITVPHITAGKQRLTVMYCGNANGEMMPPFFVYPLPIPRSFNPLNGSTEGSAIAYTKKGWMDIKTFSEFIDHFDKYAGNERPVVLLIDSASSHVDPNVFLKARAKQIELYRIVPNATHLMQPLDKGVFGPLKGKWNIVSRKYSRENPGRCIGRENFAQKLNEAYLMFYKPLTVMNAFKSAGIYPVDASRITSDMLKPGKTFSATEKKETVEKSKETQQPSKASNAQGALEVFEETLSTPTARKYRTRIEEGYNIQGVSPMFEVYKKLHLKANPAPCATTSSTAEHQPTGLDLLAEVALHNQTDKDSSTLMSPVLNDALVFPRATEMLSKPVRRTLLSKLPDNLTSPESIRAMSLRELEKIKTIAEKEKKAKLAYMRKQSSADKGASKKTVKGRVKGKSKSNPKRGKQPKKDLADVISEKSKDFCKACETTWEEDIDAGVERLWVECDKCLSWMHADCITGPVNESDEFICPDFDF